MQFPESWLREFCDPALSAEQIADVLTMGGLEVEELRTVAPSFSGVVVGRVIDVAPHPDAERLRVCRVDVGAAEPLGIVCGAPNVREGMKVPCATVGALLPPGEDGRPFEIKASTLRGVESRGMLCSSRELGIADDHGGLLELPSEAAIGADIRKVLRLDDCLFTLKLTPNLGHALSVQGVARELSALTGAPMRAVAASVVPPTSDERVPVAIDARDLCGRFSGRVIRGVDASRPTPAWMVERLARCGQRSVSVLVDISNYVMFELGRPSHIFDLDKISGGLTVRWARQGEALELLNGQRVELDAQVGVIADERAVESLAGIMGGAATAVSTGTRNIYAEAAFWWPDSVRGRSRRFGFATDAGHRFERGVDPSTTVEHLEHITRLVLQICGGEPGPVDDRTTRLPPKRSLVLRAQRAARVLGTPLTAEDCRDALARIGLDPRVDGDRIDATIPPHRFDLSIEEDLIEEVGRIRGFDRLGVSPPVGSLVARAPDSTTRSRFDVARLAASLGYQEVITFNFIDAKDEADLHGNVAPVKLINPLASHFGAMRSSLMASLLHALKRNVDRRATRVRLFETGRVFFRAPDAVAGAVDVAGVRQPLRFAGLALGDVDGLGWGVGQPTGFYEVKGDVERLLHPREARFSPSTHPALHPGRCAAISIDGQQIGFLGELHPKWRQHFELSAAPVLFELDLVAVLAHPPVVTEPISRQPPVERDLAFVLPRGVAYDVLESAIRGSAMGSALTDVAVFDVFAPEKGSAGVAVTEKSVAVRLVFEDPRTTLKDVDIEVQVQAIVRGVAGRTGARVRA